MEARNPEGGSKMTFDEAVEMVDSIANQDSDDILIKEDFNNLINDLRKTYAPTVKMTKKEYEVFKAAKVNEDSAEWLDDVEWGRVDYDYPKFFQAWLHPETIKVVDKDDR